MIAYRLMTPADIPAGVALCRAAGWNQLARDWQLFLNLSPKGCLVARDEEKVIGTVATMRYQKFFSWIGMVLVDPTYQRQGIGSQLLKDALHILQHEQTLKLDATPAGRAVYIKLGFKDEYPLSRMVCMSILKSWQQSDVRPMDKSDLAAVAHSDRTIFGADRRPLLEWMHESAPQFALMIESRNEIQGYCLGRQGFSFTHIGPVIATDFHHSQKLVPAALNNCAGKAVVLDIPLFNMEWKSWLTSIGFTEQRSLIRMYKGSNRFPGKPDNYFAILGPEFG